MKATNEYTDFSWFIPIKPKPYSDDEIKEMCNEMLFQITGEYVKKEDQCENQGDSNWQIAMYYFRKINNWKS